jgi:hypothetical protein
VPGPDVFEHPLGLGMLRNGFARNSFEVVYLDNAPAFGLDIHPCPLLMVLRAFAECLIFS